MDLEMTLTTETTATTETETTDFIKKSQLPQRDNKHINMKHQVLSFICF